MARHPRRNRRKVRRWRMVRDLATGETWIEVSFDRNSWARDGMQYGAGFANLFVKIRLVQGLGFVADVY